MERMRQKNWKIEDSAEEVARVFIGDESIMGRRGLNPKESQTTRST